MKITAAIITSHPELNKFILESISFVDEIIVVVDSSAPMRHRERSVAISLHKYKMSNVKCKIFNRPLNNNFAAQRNFALEKATSDWVLFLDDDEYVGKELAREIRKTIITTQSDAFFIKRLDVVFHQPLLHGETGNTRIIRLAKKNAGKFIRPVHETWQIGGRVGELNSPLYHIKDHFISQFISRMSSYGQVDSDILTREGKPFSYLRLAIYPKAKFFLNYFLKLGFLDGLIGFFQAYLMSVQSLTARIFQWENRKQQHDAYWAKTVKTFKPTL